MRKFSTGATRDTDLGKFDPAGFLSPYALHAFCQYMHEHRLQNDGRLRDSDNWKRGMPVGEYFKSLVRHVFDVWHCMEGTGLERGGLTDALCAVLFNAQGMLHELIKGYSPQFDSEGRAIQAVRDSLWTGEDVDRAWPPKDPAREELAAANKEKNQRLGAAIIQRAWERACEEWPQPNNPERIPDEDTSFRAVPRFDNGSPPRHGSPSPLRVYSLYDFGKFEMMESDYENRASVDLWADKEDARGLIEYMIARGWARRVE